MQSRQSMEQMLVCQLGQAALQLSSAACYTQAGWDSLRHKSQLTGD